MKRMALFLLLFACTGGICTAHPAGSKTPKYWKEWSADLDYLLEEIEKPSSLREIFKVKGIEWKRVRKEAQRRFKELAQAASKRRRQDEKADQAGFYGVLRYVVSQLRDSHAGIEIDPAIAEAWQAAQPVRYDAGIELQPAAGGVVAVSNTFAGRGSNSPLYGRGIRHEGTYLLSVNGVAADRYFEQQAKVKYEEEGGQSTLGRARVEAMNDLGMPEDGALDLVFKSLDMPESSLKKYAALDPKQREKAFKKLTWEQKQVTLRASECKQTRNPRNFIFMHLRIADLIATSDPRIWYRKLDSGIAYVNYGAVSEKSRAGLDEACQALADCEGLILDMRQNGGGGESGVDAFDKRTGSWKKPVAVLMGPKSMSAAETEIWTLQQMRSNKQVDVRFFGRTTAGASGDKIRWELPSGFAKGRFVFKHWHGGRSKIEGAGIEPDEVVDQDLVDLALGVDSCMQRAEDWLAQQK